MTKFLAHASLLDLLPASIADDPQVRAAASALSPLLHSTARALPNLLLYARLSGQENLLPPLDRHSMTLGPTSCGALALTRRTSAKLARAARHDVIPDVITPAHLLPPLARLTEARGGLQPLSLPELELLAWQFHVDFREVARTDEELAGMVRESIAWHRIKGTPASIKAALALYGYGVSSAQVAPSRAAVAQREPCFPQATAHSTQDVWMGDIVIEESGFGENWATYQLGLPAMVDAESLKNIVKICAEMAPVRCRLRRVYTEDYDIRPLILDRKFGLDRNFLDGESGIFNPDSDVVVSFGYRIYSQALPHDRTPFSAWMESCATIVDYLKSYQLDRFRLDIPLLQPVTLSTSPMECAEIEPVDHSHDLSWRVGRKVSKSQLVPDWSRLDGVNSRMDRPHVIRIGNPWRVDKYRLDASIDRQIIPIHELFHSLILHAAAERPATNPASPSVRSLQSASDEAFFELHNPRHRGQCVDNLLLDSPRKERFDLSDARTQADLAPEPSRPHHIVMPRTLARSQVVLDSTRLNIGARLDGDHITVVLNPWLLDRYKLDASIGRTTRPVPGLGVLLASLGAVDHATPTPLWLDTSRVPMTVEAGEPRQPFSTSKSCTFLLPANLPRHPRMDGVRLDNGGLDHGWLHGNPFAAAASMGGAQSIPMLAERPESSPTPTAIVASTVLATQGEARQSPALWASGWTQRPWIEHFAYLQASPLLTRIPADIQLDANSLDHALCKPNTPENPGNRKEKP